MTELAIEAEGLVKDFGDTRAVDGIDLAVRRGAVYGVLGPNGAGKTTTIRMLATLLHPDAGTARVLGHDIVREAAAVRGRMSLTGQFASVDEELNGRENLQLLGRLLGLGKRADGAGRRAARRLRPHRRRRQARARLLGRHAAAARHRGRHRRHARPALPRRADDRPRPAEPQPGVGHRARPRVRGGDRAADDAVPRRGRPARRAAGDHRPGRVIAEGTRGDSRRPSAPGRCTCGVRDPTSATRRRRVLGESLGPDVATESDPAALRPPTSTPTAPRPAGRAAAARIPSPSSPSASPAWTRCSSPSPDTPPRVGPAGGGRRHDDDRPPTPSSPRTPPRCPRHHATPAADRRRCPRRSPSAGGRCSRSSTSRCSSSTSPRSRSCSCCCTRTCSAARSPARREYLQ